MAMARKVECRTFLSTIVLTAVLGALVLASASPAYANWDPDAFDKSDVLKLRTTCPGEGEYWFPVWLVVIERHVFVRLGSPAANRVQCNTAPTLGVEVGGKRFEVHGVPSPEMANAVNGAMANKYTADLLIRWFPHPLILRLEP